MLRIKVCHTNGTEEQHVFYGDVSFVIGRTNTKIIEFSKTETATKDIVLDYEEGTVITVANWGKGL